MDCLIVRILHKTGTSNAKMQVLIFVFQVSFFKRTELNMATTDQSLPTPSESHNFPALNFEIGGGGHVSESILGGQKTLFLTNFL